MKSLPPRILFVANWKMYLDSPLQAASLARELKRKLKKGAERVAVCPPHPFLFPVAAALGASGIHLGAQDVSAFADEKHTGEVSARMLRQTGVSLVIIGHSERRSQGEGEEQVAIKIERALAAGLAPLVCLGEEERDQSGSHFAVIERQLRSAVSRVSKREAPRLAIAYEPVWAIGKSAEDALSPAELQEAVLFIRKTLATLFGRAAALKIPVLYGGSVEAANAPELLTEGGVAGFLVGRASTDAGAFARIVNACAAVRSSAPSRSR